MDLLSKHGVGGAPIRATSQLVLTPTTTDIVKLGGNYTKGFKVVGDPNLIPNNIPYDTNIFGVQGNIPILRNNNMKAGDNALVNDSNTVNTQNTSYTKVKEVQIFVGGVVRVKFDLGSYYSSASYGTIYVNGNPVGTERTGSASDGYGNPVYTTFAQDINANKNDLIQLYIKAYHANSSSAVYARNFILAQSIAPSQYCQVNI